MTDPTRTVLTLLASGKTCQEILANHDALTDVDIQRAALVALEALESPRIETRNERIQRLRETHPRAYESWTDEEDTRLVQLWDEGGPLADISRAMGRQPNAIRARLEKHLGPSWSDRAAHAPPTERGSRPSATLPAGPRKGQ